MRSIVCRYGAVDYTSGYVKRCLVHTQPLASANPRQVEERGVVGDWYLGVPPSWKDVSENCF